MPYTKVPKPVATVYINTDPVGKQQYDEASITYDDANVFYDSVNPNQYTKVAKPIIPTYTKVPKPI